MVKLMEVVLRGFPQSSYDLDEDLRPYHKYRHVLHIAGGVVCYKERAVKTETAGVEDHPRGSPGSEWHDQQGGGHSLLARDITEHYQDQWGLLVRDASSQPAGVPVPPPSPSFPFQYVVGDYFSMTGVNYLILGDRFSGWLSIYEAGKGEFDAKGW
jgi:hypothetical protein